MIDSTVFQRLLDSSIIRPDDATQTVKSMRGNVVNLRHLKFLAKQHRDSQRIIDSYEAMAVELEHYIDNETAL